MLNDGTREIYPSEKKGKIGILQNQDLRVISNKE